MPNNALFTFIKPQNEAPLDYGPGSEEKKEIKNRLAEMMDQVIEIPLIIGGQEVRTGRMREVCRPDYHEKVIAKYHKAGEAEVRLAIDAAQKAKHAWERMPWDKRAKIFKKAAALIAGPYRATINAATMLGQGKSIYQSEVEAVCELVDFLQFNTYYLNKIYTDQPESLRTEINQVEYRPLEGFVFAATPFNFTAIAGNLPSAPALCGNTLLWKPSSSAIYSNYMVMKVFEEAGLPPGVINFIPGPSQVIGDLVLKHPDLAGVHFTGSSRVFNHIWNTIGQNIHQYKTYPRIVGETGGKDFLVAHPSADQDEVLTALARGAYEYQGQKCSAASRAYIPESLWTSMQEEFIHIVQSLKVGPVTDFTNFVNAVIDQKAFDKITAYIEQVKTSEEAEILVGGEYDDSKGYYIWPTVIKTDHPKFITMEEEIFGPVLTVYVYPDNQYEEILKLCDETSPYGLTGGIFAKNRDALILAEDILTHSAGNLYINDKPTGSIVGQQPFGGARASGTNDKAGSMWNIMRWISPRSIKENLDPPKDYRYPYLEEE